MMGEAAKRWNAAVEDPSKLVADNDHLAGELAASMRREQDLLAENQKLKSERDHWKANHDNQVKLKNEVAETRFAAMAKQIEDLLCENRRLKTELAAAPHWVPVAEFENDSASHIVWDADDEDAYDAKFDKHSSEWRVVYSSARLRNVTHVLVVLNPPVSNEDPRGDGDLLPENERLDNLTRECMRDEFDKMIEITRKMDEPPVATKPKRDLIVAESPNGPWHVWEQKTPGDYTLVAGPFNFSELAHATADKIRAEKDTSNDLAGDASDVERANRERLMQSFLGSEAEKLGATKYQLRDGERWEYLKRGVEWDFVDGLPCWFDDDTYRLAIGD